MINVKVLESDHSFSIVEMFSFSITVSLVPLVFTARLNLRANCDGAFKYVIKGKQFLTGTWAQTILNVL